MSTLSLSQAPEKSLRTALSVVAAVETVFAIIQSLTLFAPDAQTAHGFLAEQITTTHLVAVPILATAALVFATRGLLSEAIIALAAVVISTWISELVSGYFTGMALFLAAVVRPVVAAFAITLADRRTWLLFSGVLSRAVGCCGSGPPSYPTSSPFCSGC